MLKAEAPPAAPRPSWLHPGRRGLGLAVVIAVLLLPATSGRASTRARVSSPDGLNLRDAPTTAGNVVSVLPYGAAVDLIDGPAEDGWYHVGVGGQQGYVKGTYLDFAAPFPLKGDVLVTPPDGVRLRAAASTSAPILAVLQAGRTVHVTGDATPDGWYPVQAPEGAGWVDGSYLQAMPADAQTVRVTWYGHEFDGALLACGGVFSADDPGVAAANGYPCGAHLKICQGSRCVTVMVRDRGHMATGAIDLSAAAFQRLAPLATGVLAGTLQITTDPVAMPAPAPSSAPSPSASQTPVPAR